MQINVQRRLADSNAASLISKARNMFPRALLTPCISFRKHDFKQFRGVYISKTM